MPEQKENKEQERAESKAKIERHLDELREKIKPWDQKAFDKVYGLAELFLDKGYVRAWFSYLEWLLITSALFAIGKEAKSAFTFTLAFASAILLFFVGLVSIHRAVAEHLPDKTSKKPLYLFLMVVASFGAPVVLMKLLGDVIGRVLFK